MGGTTGVGLEQGLGLTDLLQYHERARAVGPETSAALRRIIILLFIKLI